jgi:predicted nuclease of predicted toxin-antitoxin system
VRIILDEQLDPTLANVLNVLRNRHGCEFVSLRDLAPPKTQDIEIPKICRDNGAIALVTADVKDFGAKKVYFEALLEAGVSVVTLRPQKRIHVLESQTALLLEWSREVAAVLRDATEPVLVRVNNSGVSPRSLQELIDEVR